MVLKTIVLPLNYAPYLFSIEVKDYHLISYLFQNIFYAFY